MRGGINSVIKELTLLQHFFEAPPRVFVIDTVTQRCVLPPPDFSGKINFSEKT